MYLQSYDVWYYIYRGLYDIYYCHFIHVVDWLFFWGGLFWPTHLSAMRKTSRFGCDLMFQAWHLHIWCLAKSTGRSWLEGLSNWCILAFGSDQQSHTGIASILLSFGLLNASSARYLAVSASTMVVTRKALHRAKTGPSQHAWRVKVERTIKPASRRHSEF